MLHGAGLLTHRELLQIAWLTKSLTSGGIALGATPKWCFSMPSTIRIERLRRGSNRFSLLLGPVFGSRQIAEEVGVNAYDDADKEWLAAFDGKSMVGWLSVRGRVVSDCYVIPGSRSRGVLGKLLTEAVASFGLPLRATCTAASVSVFSKAGFKAIRKTKNFTVMELRHA